MQEFMSGPAQSGRGRKGPPCKPKKSKPGRRQLSWATKSTTHTSGADMESGADMDRAGLNRMLQAVRNREVDMVIAYAHDRLSREPLDLLNIQRVFIDAGVSLEFVRGPSDTSLRRSIYDLLPWIPQRRRSGSSWLNARCAARNRLPGTAACPPPVGWACTGTTTTPPCGKGSSTKRKPG